MENFEILEKLGEGSFSTVYKVRRKIDNQLYALKKVSLQNLKEKNILNSLNEIRLLASIKSNYIISYKEAFYEEKENSLIIIMEYADNGDLHKKIKNLKKNNKYFEEKEIWKILIQLIKGLKSLHDLNILHRDIKTANIFLFNNGMVKLGDLNISKVAKKGLTSTQTGTPYYASPEVWKDLSYNYKSDIWSLGCVLYEIITLNLPFSNNLGDLYKNIMKGEIKKIPDRYSNDLDNIVHLLIQVNQDKRPSCKDLLNNPIIKNKIEYFKNIDIDNLNDKYDDMDNSFLLKTIEIPKNFTKTPFRLPKSNYSKNENEKYLDNLSYSNINNKSAFKEKNNRNIYNNYNLPFIKNTRKIMYNKGKINYDNSQFGIQKIINNIKYNNNFDEEINMNKDHKINHNNLLNNYNIQLIKIRNNRNNNIFNKNIINNSNDNMKIIKLYKPYKIYNQTIKKIKSKNKELINKTEEQILPTIKRNNYKNIYSKIKINPRISINK